MSRILFISPLDRRSVPNTREQNISAACRALGHDSLSLVLTQNTDRAPLAVLRDALRWRVETLDEGRVLAVDPLFNPCTGLKSNLDVAAARPGAGSRLALRRRLVGLLSPLGLLRDLAVIPAFVAVAWRCGRFDLCIAYGPWATCVGWLLRSLGRVDLLVYDDQDYEPAILHNRLRQRWAVLLERSMMQRADRVVSIGHRLAALRRAQCGCAVVVIPNGVAPAAPPRPRPPQRPLTLAYVGNLVGWSGLDLMLQALPGLLAGGLRLQVLIIGDGQPAYRDGLLAQVEAAGLQKVVRFVGRVPHAQVADWLGQADVGLAHFRPEAYRRYAFPLKVVEYMAAGLAVIGTADTETEDIVLRHGCGLAIECSSTGIAAAVRRLAGDAALLWRCRQAALAAAPLYRWPQLAAQQLALVGLVAPAGPAAG